MLTELWCDDTAAWKRVIQQMPRNDQVEVVQAFVTAADWFERLCSVLGIPRADPPSPSATDQVKFNQWAA
jgi:hypothetical protein